MPPVNRNQPVRAESSESRYSLMEFMQRFPDDATCLNYLWRTRHAADGDGDGERAFCTKCMLTRVFKHYEDYRPTCWTCTGCGDHIHPTSGTIFHKSSTSLHLWFYAMYIMASTRCGISAKQLERELGVTYKTAWRMFHLIRNQLMPQEEEAMGGHIEMDESYFGGKLRQSDRRKFDHLTGTAKMQAAIKAGRDKKTSVFGMVERGGNVVAKVIPSNSNEEIMEQVRRECCPAQ